MRFLEGQLEGVRSVQMLFKVSSTSVTSRNCLS